MRDVLGADHLCFLLHEVVEGWDLSEFEAAYSDAGGQSPYDPRLMLKVWLYAFALNVRTTRKLEQRVREDLGFRFLAGGAEPDHKTLSEFHRRHALAIRRLFTQVLRLLRKSGLAQVGTVAIDSTRIKANASRHRVLRETDVERKVAEWQKHLDDDPDRTPGTRVGIESLERVREQLQRVRDSGEKRLSETDPEARFVRDGHGHFQLGYTAENRRQRRPLHRHPKSDTSQKRQSCAVAAGRCRRRRMPATARLRARRRRFFQSGKPATDGSARHRGLHSRLQFSE